MRSTRGCAARAGSRTGRGPRGSSRALVLGRRRARPSRGKTGHGRHGCVAAVRGKARALGPRPVARAARRPERRLQPGPSRPAVVANAAARGRARPGEPRQARRRRRWPPATRAAKSGLAMMAPGRSQRLARQHVVTEGLAQTGIAFETAHQQADLVGGSSPSSNADICSRIWFVIGLDSIEQWLQAAVDRLAGPEDRERTVPTGQSIAAAISS